MTETKEDNQISQIDQKPEVSSKNNDVGHLLISIKEYTCDPKKKPQIDRVPTRLRLSKLYKDCCDPLVVSIGPYHSGKPQLREFEELKIPIAQKFCDVYCKEKSIDQLYFEVAKQGGIAFEYYEKDQIKHYTEEMCNKMMFLDACFVLYFIFFFVKDESSNSKTDEVQNEVDARLNKSYYLVLRDLFLLENQIPLSVLKVLISESEETVINNFIGDFCKLLMTRHRISCTEAVKKFLAYVMGFNYQTKKEHILNLDGSPHLLHLVREKLIRSSSAHLKCESGETINQADARKINLRESYRSVTDLESAGVYFKASKIGNLSDVNFKSCLCFGILTLPSIKVDHLTKPLLLNLVAYEMCPHGPLDMRITSYICLMDSLIDHADDVKELRKKRILVNKLGSDDHLAHLFNEIANDLVPVNDPYAYVHAKWKIGKHCKSKRHIWMAEWMHKYFSSPWTLMAFLGALLVIALTMIQTYFTVYPP